MNGKRYAVLDKSFLMGARVHAFADLSERYCFLATGALLGECFQTFLPSQGRDEQTRERNVWALRKFSGETSSLYRIPDTGFLIAIETRSRRPCWPIEDYIGSRIQFNPTYFNGEKRLRHEESRIVEKWSAYVAENVQATIDCYERGNLWPMCKWDDAIAVLVGEESLSSREVKSRIIKKLPQFQKRISEDEDFVRSQYGWMRPFTYPAAQKLSRQWLLFRSIQVSLLVHLNLIEKSGANPIKMSLRTVSHEWLDYQYCLLAAQFGILATGEASQMARFRLLCPNGITLFHNPRTQSVTEYGP